MTALPRSQAPQARGGAGFNSTKGSAMAKKKPIVKRQKTARVTERAVLVTTAHRGVFFGYANGDIGGDTIILKRARLCSYWSKDMKGFLGLASMGPSSSCRIGQPADSITLLAVTSVSEVSPAAVEKWEASPWA